MTVPLFAASEPPIQNCNSEPLSMVMRPLLLKVAVTAMVPSELAEPMMIAPLFEARPLEMFSEPPLLSMVPWLTMLSCGSPSTKSDRPLASVTSALGPNVSVPATLATPAPVSASWSIWSLAPSAMVTSFSTSALSSARMSRCRRSC